MKPILSPANILLPKQDPSKWAVIACDQYTSNPDYWHTLADFIGDTPSSLKIIFPEVFLADHKQERICAINATMREYLSGGVLEEFPDTFVYVRRQTSTGIRQGIVGLIDLFDYSFEKNSHARIRATEETVTERIPPRVEIRKDASLEIPHVMLLIDDPGKTVIEPLAKKTACFSVLYDFNLCAGGGHIQGFAPDKDSEKAIQQALEVLAKNNNGFVFAVGDGNHSLACAKECYRQNPTERSRYALVEVVNLHDPSLCFEPIYRVLFDADPQAVIDDFTAFCGTPSGENVQTFTCVYGDVERTISVNALAPLPVGTLQLFLEYYLSSHSKISVDYIHGENSVRTLARKPGVIGFLFNGMKKSELFPAVAKGGSLPRKTFSMGSANDKRFYLECRRLTDSN